MERLVRLILLACTGCAQLFGIEDTTSGAGATLELTRASVGATVVKAPDDITTGPVFLVPSADPSGVTQVPGMATTPGTWTGKAKGAVGVVYTARGMPAVQEALELGDIQVNNHIVYEHPNPAPAQASMLMVDVTLPGTYASGQTLEVAAIGAWTGYTLSGTELPAAGASAISTMLDYSKFTALTESPPAQITKADQVLVLRYSGSNLTGSLIVPPFDQTAGPDPIMGTMQQLTPTTPFDAAIDLAAAQSRFAKQLPQVTLFGAQWQLTASPGYEVGSSVGVQLLGATLAVTDTTFSSSYANPFVSLGWKPMLTLIAAQSRTVTVGSMMTTVGSFLSTTADPGAGLMLKFPVGLPTAITLDATPLTNDGATVMADTTRALGVDLTVDMPSPLYVVTVEELTAGTMGVTTTSVITVVNANPHLTLPPNVLQAGHTYALVAVCASGGFPNAASGDLATFALPVSFGSETSAVFTVASP